MQVEILTKLVNELHQENLQLKVNHASLAVEVEKLKAENERLKEEVPNASNSEQVPE